MGFLDIVGEILVDGVVLDGAFGSLGNFGWRRYSTRGVFGVLRLIAASPVTLVDAYQYLRKVLRGLK